VQHHPNRARLPDLQLTSLAPTSAALEPWCMVTRLRIVERRYRTSGGMWSGF
jgi:hypothetical protein